MNEREFEFSSKPTVSRKSNCRNWSLAPVRAGTDIISRSADWSSRAPFSLPKIAVPSLTALGKSLPWQRANCTTSRSDRKARACL
jgi:hypothetical protein